tara:strand:- start:520 stop:870 length:351 start_codon:yes stop_codon:yes gene_type:complete
MVKLESLKRDRQFKLVLGGKRIHNDFFSVFAKKNLKDVKNEKVLRISFVIKKKEIGSAVKRNKIRRKLKAIVIKLVKIKGAINQDYTYIVFGKSKTYKGNHKVLFNEMTKIFKKIN